MNKIAGLKELHELLPGEKFLVITEGKKRQYHYQGMNAKTGAVVAISGSSHNETVCFTEGHFHKGVFLSGDYDSKTVGQVMIDQLKHEIEVIQEIYFS